MRLRTKLLLLLVAFAIVPAVLLSLLAFDTFQVASRRTTLESLSGLASAKADAIEQFTDSRKKDVQRIAEVLGEPVEALRSAEKAASSAPKRKATALPPTPLPDLDDARMIQTEGDPARPHPPLQITAEPPPAAPAPPAAPPKVPPEVVKAKSELTRMLGLILGEQATFEELLVIAPDGRVIASTFGEHEGKTAKDVEYFKRGLAGTFVQPVFISPITKELTMVIATPIRSKDNDGVGVLAARLNLKRFFRMINDYTGLGETGETVVAKKLDDKVLFMAPTRHDDAAALNRSLSVDRSRDPLVAGARGDTGSGVELDYRGTEVLAAWTFVPSLEWGLVVKLDAAEAREPVHDVGFRLLWITTAILVLALVASIYVGRAIVRPLGELKDATEKISKGDFEVELDIRSADEIGELADSFERMVAAIKFFRERSYERAEIDLDDDVPAASTGED